MADGTITAFDFDNCLRFFYLYDLADIWSGGRGWCMFERDVRKRREYMQTYFAHVIEGYRTQTHIDDSEFEMLPLIMQAVLVEGIVDEFECAVNANERVEADGGLLYKMKCLEENIPYFGFFDAIYNPDKPFEL